MKKKIRKNKKATITAEQIRVILDKAGFVMVTHKCKVAPTTKELHDGDTIIIPEGSNKSYKL